MISIPGQGQTFNAKDSIPITTKTFGYLSGSSYLPFAFGIGISANLEIPVFQKKWLSLNFKGTYGILGFGDYDGGSNGYKYGLVSTVILLGKGRSKFEITIGVGTAASTGPRRTSIDGLIPNLGLGVRYYWSDYFVRGGIAFPELTNISYGLYF